MALFVLLGTIATTGTAVVDGDPTTVPDWNTVVNALIGLAVTLGLFAARDADRSSQDSGIRR